MLTASDASAAAMAGVPLSQVSDTEVNGQAGTDDRIFASSDHTTVIEVQLFAYSCAGSDCADSATPAYPMLRDEYKQGFQAGKSVSMPPPQIGTASQMDEFIGLWGKGGTPAGLVTFQQGQLLATVLWLNASNFFPADEAQGVAEAESHWITQKTGE